MAKGNVVRDRLVAMGMSRGEAQLLTGLGLQVDNVVAEATETFAVTEVFLAVAVVYGNVLRTPATRVIAADAPPEQIAEARALGTRIHDIVTTLRAPETAEEQASQRPPMPDFIRQMLEGGGR